MAINKIVIIGKGSWGSAIAHALSLADNTEIHNLGHLLDTELIQSCNVIIIATPSSACLDVISNLQQLNLDAKQIVLIASKGISQTQPFFLSDFATKLLPCEIGVISGPSFAGEVTQNIFTAIDLAINNNLKLATKLADHFSTQYFRIKPQENIYALQIAGCMKNIMAIWAGIAAGKKLGHNTLSYILTLGLQDIYKLTLHYNPDVKIDSLSIFGDYFLTTTSHQSRNYSFGKELTSQTNIKSFINTYPSLVEGINATYSISSLSKSHNATIPLIELLLDIFEERDNIDDVLKELLKS